MLSITDVRLGNLENSIYVKPFQMKYNQNGVEKTWDLIECHASVSVILYNVSRNVLVCVKQFRPAVYVTSVPKEFRLQTIDTEKFPPSLGLSLEFCAGMMDKNKSPEVTAAEEVLEECGYEVDPQKLEKVKSFRCGVGTSGDVQTLYYAEVTDDMKVSKGGGVDDELLEVVELTLDEGRKLLDAKDVQCPGLRSITADDWVGYCRHVQNLEEEYWQKDGQMENFVESMIIPIDRSESEDDLQLGSSESE